jgi:hypothetical protein
MLQQSTGQDSANEVSMNPAMIGVAEWQDSLSLRSKNPALQRFQFALT